MIRKIAGLVFLASWCQISSAADAFSATAVVGPQTASVGFTTVEQAFDSLRQQNLSSIVPAYTGSEVASIAIDFRGLPLATSYPIANDPRLTLNIPSLGISQTFFGATREESRQLLRDFFKNGDALGRIMKESARISPVDPIAGNPNSLQSRMVSGTFARSLRFAAQSFGDVAIASKKSSWLVAAAGDGIAGLGRANSSAAQTPSADVGFELAGYRQAGLSSVGVSVPWSYSFPPDPDRPFSLEGDIQYTDTQGAKTYGLTVGPAYNFRISDGWYLIPAGSFGITGSQDLGAFGEIVSVSLSSAARLYKSAGTTLMMGNSVNYLRTLNASIGGYSSDPKLANTVFVNGFVLSAPFTSLGRNFGIEYSLTDTRYTGSDLYNQRSDELGVAIVRNSRSSYLRAGLSYLNGTHSKGWMFNLHYAF